MHPILDLGFIQIPVYGLCAIIGFIVAFSLYMHNARGRHINGWDVLYSSLYVIAGIFFGAKILYFITKVPVFIKGFALFKDYSLNDIFEYLIGGYVFYGGLIGGAFAFARYCIKYKLPVASFAEAAAPAIPLFHAFGRMGCLFAGCCYGMEYDGPFAITYPLNLMTTDIAGVPRFPTPIAEALFNLVLCVILLIFTRKHGGTVSYKWKLKYDKKTRPMILSEEGFIVVAEDYIRRKAAEENASVTMDASDAQDASKVRDSSEILRENAVGDEPEEKRPFGDTPAEKSQTERLQREKLLKEKLLTEEKIRECPVEYINDAGEEMIISFMNRPVRKPALYKKAFSPFGVYLIGYGVFRFVIEFTRNDSIRGGIGALSTSQWVSLVLVPIGIFLLIRKKNVQKEG